MKTNPWPKKLSSTSLSKTNGGFLIPEAEKSRIMTKISKKLKKN